MDKGYVFGYKFVNFVTVFTSKSQDILAIPMRYNHSRNQYGGGKRDESNRNRSKLDSQDFI